MTRTLVLAMAVLGLLVVPVQAQMGGGKRGHKSDDTKAGDRKRSSVFPNPKRSMIRGLWPRRPMPTKNRRNKSIENAPHVENDRSSFGVD
jgi:hypothetical protein